MVWQSGIHSEVRFPAWIPARRAAARASPFASLFSDRRRKAFAPKITVPEATARLSVAGFFETSTIRTDPLASTCVNFALGMQGLWRRIRHDRCARQTFSAFRLGTL